ncbi:VOC family protein [Pseudonocardia sp. TRM90224]|uniref:VOC family protein n=1 Tax=Pseudonocardia sp. TRM90224 TaxID=2812678 RepID=UPI001E58BFBE|nr:VOC family protein [Pseudonocardia sp. TRM90224]
MDIQELYPRLVVEGADAAITFYEAAFGAELLERFADDGGRVMHAMLALGPYKFAIKDAGHGDPAPSEGGIPVIMALYVTDADAVGKRMEDAGASVMYPIADQEYGERGGRLRDPFGHQWMIAQK